MGDALCDHFFVDGDGGETSSPFPHHADADDLFNILETWEQDCAGDVGGQQQLLELEDDGAAAAKKKTAPAGSKRRRAAADEGSPKTKRSKCSPPESKGSTSHIAVERNRRKQMNENLAVLRSLMPCFYVKRGDQASIIGGVVDYIRELQQVLHSLEAKKKRKTIVLSPRPPASSSSCCSPRPPPLSPRLPPAAPPISPCRTPPTPGSPYNIIPHLRGGMPVSGASSSCYASPAAMTPTSLVVGPEVKVEFAGANLVLRTVSQRSPGQAVRIIGALEGRSLEILHAKISTVDDTAVNSFTVKIGIECELSAEELVQEIQQTFT
uniref:BHLH domain-containing protein n=1 Tax=Leersia perrieri TaxID=77586 RepID=A0A0D9WQT6_9ORYZ